MYVAYGKVHGLVTIVLADFIHGFVGVNSLAERNFREKALDVIYDLGADDDYKDELRKTLTVVPHDEFTHDLTNL